MSVNPYDYEDTCTCSARSPGECGCGGYVDRGQVRAWQQGYDAARADLAKAWEEGRCAAARGQKNNPYVEESDA